MTFFDFSLEKSSCIVYIIVLFESGRKLYDINNLFVPVGTSAKNLAQNFHQHYNKTARTFLYFRLQPFFLYGSVINYGMGS